MQKFKQSQFSRISWPRSHQSGSTNSPGRTLLKQTACFFQHISSSLVQRMLQESDWMEDDSSAKKRAGRGDVVVECKIMNGTQKANKRLLGFAAPGSCMRQASGMFTKNSKCFVVLMYRVQTGASCETSCHRIFLCARSSCR